MHTQEKNTKSLILKTANFVFINKGIDGARMQEIADKASVNKALLQYYYGSKKKHNKKAL